MIGSSYRGKPMRAGIVLSAALLIAAGAAQADAPRRPAVKPMVVSSVAPVTDIVRHVAGDAAAVVGIIPEGRDSHTYEPAPGDAGTLSGADIIILNGLHLETPIEKLAKKVRKPSAAIVELGDATIT